MTADNLVSPTILVFDSGVGGLSIYQEVRQLLPGCRYVYASDNQAFPYGTKKENEVVARVSQVLQSLMRRYAPNLLVVACNTASTVALPKIRDRINIPVVGVVPAIKPAASLSRTKVLGLLATPGTVRRAYTQSLIDEFASDCRVIRVGSSELVELAEDKLRGKSPDLAKIRDITSPLFDSELAPGLDTVVLGCTHFPLLREELEIVAPRKVMWVDSGRAIAERVCSLLAGGKTEFTENSHADSNRAVFTAPGPDAASLDSVLRAMGFLEVEFLLVGHDPR
jgi:glutamate racemase